MPVVRNVWLPILVLMPASAASAGCARAARPAFGSVEKSPDWLTLTLAQLPRRKGYFSFSSFSAIAYHE
jgi:hypothetical protein